MHHLTDDNFVDASNEEMRNLLALMLNEEMRNFGLHNLIKCQKEVSRHSP